MDKTSHTRTNYKPTPHSKSAIQAYSSEEEEESEESSVYEEEKEQFTDSGDEQTAATSYNESFLKKDDFTIKEIKEYKASLIHDEDSVMQRLEEILENNGELNVVMIAEKPNIAELISRVLSEDYYSKDIWKGFKSYHFNNLDFKGFYANCTVLSVYGNLYEYDFDRESNISKENPIDILVNNPVYLYRTKIFNQRNRMRKNVANLEYLEDYLKYYN